MKGMWRESESSVKPWKFNDENLELLYQEFSHRTLLTRFAPLAFFVFAFIYITEISVIIIRFYGSHVWSSNEAFWFFIKMIQLVVGTYINYYQSGWSDQARVLGCTCTLWSCRIFYCACICHEFGVPQHPAQHLYAQLWHPVHGAMMAPSFEEYAVLEALYALIRPLSFLIIGKSCAFGDNNACPTGEQLWTITFQRFAIGIIAGGMVYHIQGDRRRAWLLQSG